MWKVIITQFHIVPSLQFDDILSHQTDVILGDLADEQTKDICVQIFEHFKFIFMHFQKFLFFCISNTFS